MDEIPAERPLTGVVVVNYGSHRLLQEMSADLSGTESTVVVIVDNPSTVQERSEVVRLVAEQGWHGVYPEVNGGFGAGINVGARTAAELGCDVLIFVNPDTRFAPETIPVLAAEVRRDPRKICSPVIHRPDGSIWFAGLSVSLDTGDTVPSGSPRSLPWLSGAFMALSRNMFEALAGFDERYFMYWEDVDLSVRGSQLGGILQLVTAVEVTHAVGGTQGGVKTDAYVYYNCRNRLLFASQNLSNRDLLRWIWTTPRASLLIAMRGFSQRSRPQQLRAMFAALRGSLAGLGAAAPRFMNVPANRLGRMPRASRIPRRLQQSSHSP